MGFYPNWSTFVKTIPRLLRAKRKYFASKQESARKDMERHLGCSNLVLQLYVDLFDTGMKKRLQIL